MAKNPNLDQETAYTICKMIDCVGWDLVEDWDWNWLGDIKEDYRPLIKHSLLSKTWKALQAKEWLSFQTTNLNNKQISTIAPLKGLTNLRSLILQENLIEDIGPLIGMERLTKLNCFQNRVSDLSPLKQLQSLNDLTIGGNPLTSMEVLESLPNLKRLSFTPDQAGLFTKCKKLPALIELTIYGDEKIDSLEHFPEMESLRSLSIRGLKNLKGIERYGSLENLDLSGGSFSSLENLKQLKKLTHLELSSSEKIDVSPLNGLFALRSLAVWCKDVLSLQELSALPALHEVRTDLERQKTIKGLRGLEKTLSPWDTEFGIPKPKATPSTRLEVVSQETFDFYDGKNPYGILPGETNERMVGSEANWLVGKIKEALLVRFEEDVDFCLPCSAAFQRSERVIIYSLEAYESFRDVALTIQQVLCETKNDWIIWCQTLLRESPEEQDVPEETEDFTIWIYPNKIMVAKEQAKAVQSLMAWVK